MIVFLAYAVLSRLAYVLYVGFVLRREELYGPSGNFRRFRRRASFVMNNDAVAFVALCVATRNTLHPAMPRALSVAIGVALAIIGLGTKLWAARTLGGEAYYWQNFFEPESGPDPATSGPYRFIRNPMYTVGYLQTYGLALIMRSLPGLFMSAFAQAAILTFHFLVE